jgi:protein-S-isoprenylcysteine O-methyltransferase Ste14
MEKRLSRWGAGPKIIGGALVYGGVALGATYARPDIFEVQCLPRSVCIALGVILLALGVPMWLVSVTSVMKAYNRDRLVTSGLYAVVRHPLYSAWITLNLPGLALLFRSWPGLLMPFLAYAVFKLNIRVEDEYLRNRFGQAYVDYRARVNEIIPVPRFWRGGARP